MWNYLNEVYDDVVDWWNNTSQPVNAEEDTPTSSSTQLSTPPIPITDPADADGETPVAPVVQGCPLDNPESDQKKSLYIDLGWAFTTTGNPLGTYVLTVAGQTFIGALANGQIRLDEELDSLCGDGELIISVTNGPIFRANLTLDLPNVQEIEGIKRRLTNLGYYAGSNESYDERAAWAVRAFKRKAINGYEHNATELENDAFTEAFLTALRDAYGVHPGDNPATIAPATVVQGASAECGMFGTRVLKRGAFEGKADDEDVTNTDDRSLPNDLDPNGNGNNGIWGSVSTQGTSSDIAGTFRLFLRAFDPQAGDLEMHNKVNLPQPIHMLQFVLFELGFWVIGGTYVGSGTAPTQTKKKFTPDGGFGANTQWAVRELQCSAKFPNSAKEDVLNADNRYLPRLFANSPTPNDGVGRYPNDGFISGAINTATRVLLQHWADQRQRCPIIVYASTDTTNPVANGSNMGRLVKENLWKYDDHADIGPRMFSIDYSRYYTIPGDHGGTVSVGTSTFPRPIVIGGYTIDANHNFQGGPATVPRFNHVWDSQYTEVRPDTMVVATDPGDGSTLTASQLSTFKVIRTAAHFECLGYFDALNAYDDVIISLGPCHWTLARGTGALIRNQAREMPAMLSYFRNTYANSYDEFFGRFGLFPSGTWPLTMGTSTGTYNSRINIQTETRSMLLHPNTPNNTLIETNSINLSGVHGTPADGLTENTYCKTWHSYYRFQMACRTSQDMRNAMWGFSRIRARDILNKTFTIQGADYRVGDYATSEKSVAMLLRWHIYRPGHLFRSTNNHLRTVMTNIVTATYTNDNARETAFINQLVTRANTVFGAGVGAAAHLTSIQGWTNIPQTGTRSYYDLDLDDPVLNATANSFNFETP